MAYDVLFSLSVQKWGFGGMFSKGRERLNKGRSRKNEMKFKSDCENEVKYFQIQKYFTVICPVFSVAVIFSTCAG